MAKTHGKNGRAAANEGVEQSQKEARRGVYEAERP